MPKKLLFLFITLLVFKSNAQQEELILLNTVPLKLISNANAIVRHDDETVTLLKLNKMNYSRNRIVTVLNSSGDTKHGAVIHYDKNIVVKKMTARIYNSKGKEIKKIKKNDFEDISAVQGGTLYSDSRVKYLNYIPTEYPYTIHFEAEIEYNSTAFIPHWTPIDNYYTSVQNSSYKIINLSPTEVNTKASNFEEYAIEEVGEHGYMAQNLPAIEPEAYSPSFANVVPSLKVSLTQFEMEGVRGVNTNWEDFGNWMYEALIKNTQELPEDVITEVNQLTQGAKNDIEKAKIIYKYVQEKTRYISVQVGIGGWKPMPASDVHKLGYGDCKGLTNYTKTLLKQVGVESYYTVIYGGREIKNIDATFSSIQGNHVILCLPLEEEYLWLECTSKTAPFAYNANFTDDRDALILTPKGGKIVHTKIYPTQANLLSNNATILLQENGDVSANVTMKSYGTQYGYRSQNELLKEKDKILEYKDYWSYINSFQVSDIKHYNNKDSIVFTEKLNIKAERYATKMGSSLLFQPNLFNRYENIPHQYENRKLPFEINRGFVDRDTYQITIPENFEVDALMDNINISNTFGEYKASIESIDSRTLVYSRTLQLNKGSYTNEEYDAFRKFLLQIKKGDKSKIIIKLKS